MNGIAISQPNKNITPSEDIVMNLMPSKVKLANKANNFTSPSDCLSSVAFGPQTAMKSSNLWMSDMEQIILSFVLSLLPHLQNKNLLYLLSAPPIPPHVPLPILHPCVDHINGCLWPTWREEKEEVRAPQSLMGTRATPP